MRKALIVLCIIATVVLGTSSVAHAAPPSNDDIANATVITTPTFSDALDTREATAAATDLGCGAATVWYQHTPSTNTQIQVETGGYETFVGLFSGDPSSPTNEICTQYSMTATLQAGQTYYISVGSSYWGPPPPGAVGPGGDLVVNMYTQEIPPLLTSMTATVDSVTVDRVGVVTISGTVTCDQVANAYISGSLVQRFQRTLAQGYVNAYASCGPEPTTWTTQLASYTQTIFSSGKATLQAYAYAYDYWGGYATVDLTRDVQLRRR
jgi:hypothetical protein